MIGLLLTLLGAGLVAIGAPWWLVGVGAMPGLLWGPGLPWARLLQRETEPSALQLALDGAWLGMAITWIDVAVVRELGLREDAVKLGLCGLALLWAAIGAWLARGRPTGKRPPRRELLGLGGVLIAVVGLVLWRTGDLVRPMDGSWYLTGADDEGRVAVDLRGGEGFADARILGWEEAGAWAHGSIVLAVRGPIGSRVAVGKAENTVRRRMVEDPEEGPVARYLGAGVAAIEVAVDLPPGGSLPVEVEGDTLYLFDSAEAVWAAHATGELRFVHYYQLLNQVENEDWARELLVDRRFTWNQPPGWSPLLAVASALVMPDLPGANLLFLAVIALVGASVVRAGSLMAPGAPGLAWLIPGGMVAAHGLLMLEPMSANFPDSLYAGAVIGVVIALASGRPWAFAAMGLAAGMLRYPGIPLATGLALLYAWSHHQRPWPGLARLWAGVAVAVVVVGIGVALGEVEDLLFILWFETFPEHWHGSADPLALLSRVPDFYLSWTRYSGGALPLAALVAILAGPSPARRELRFIMGGAIAYSLVLCTIDHHPTHYFLPLCHLAATGALIASATARHPWIRALFSAMICLGLWIFLWSGQV